VSVEESVLPAAGSREPAHYDATFIGRGFFWPMQVDHTGSIRLTDGPADLDRSMAVVLATAPGERVMRPQFGCRIWDLLFEPVTANLLGLMAQADADDGALIVINVTYRVKATNDRRNLVYPFYVIPHEES
jgi:hypothetical protein